MAVKTAPVRLEDDEAVEHGGNRDLAPRAIARPQLKVSAKLFFPARIDVQDKVDRLIELVRMRMPDRIGVDPKGGALPRTMKTATAERPIDAQFRFSRQYAKIFDEAVACQLIDNEPGRRWKLLSRSRP